MSFKKSLGPEEKSVTSFEVNKTFTLTEADSGSGIYSIPLTKSSDSNLYNFDHLIRVPVFPLKSLRYKDVSF